MLLAACNVSLTNQEYYCNLSSMAPGTNKTIYVVATASFATLFPNVVKVSTPNDINPDNDVSNANVYVVSKCCSSSSSEWSLQPRPAGVATCN